MDIAAVVARLRDKCPSFERRIAGAVEAALPDHQRFRPPAAFVMPMDETASDSSGSSPFRQTISETFGVLVMLPNSPDQRGEAALNRLAAIRAELFRAILGWSPTPSIYAPIQYERGDEMGFDPAVFLYRFVFLTRMDVDQTDGALIDPDADAAFSGIDLTLDPIDPRIAATPANQLPQAGPDGEPAARARIDLEQEEG